MWRYSCLFVFVTLLQGALSQGPPRPPCGPPPHENPSECCKMPQLFADDVRSECGVGADDTEPKPKPDCSKVTCMFKKNNLMKDETNVDKEAMIAFVDKWIAENSAFGDAMSRAKNFCLKDDVPEDKKICEPGRIISCLYFVTFDSCPTWEKNEKCDKLKEYIDQCKETFKKPIL